MIANKQSRQQITDATKTVVLYHANCLDGFGAAYATWLTLGDSGVAYVPVQYGDNVPEDLEGKTVYVLDFCYPLEVMVDIAQAATKLIVIDHHKTSGTILSELQEYSYNISVTWDDTKSGAVLAWEYFDPYKDAPFGLQMIEDRDLWKFAYKNTKNFCTGLADTVARNFESWYEAFIYYEYLITERGKIINKIFDKECQELIDSYSYTCYIHFWENPEVEFAEKGLACNAPAKFASELGNLLALRSGTYGAVWQYEGAGKYKVSLRSIGDYDVEVIARYYGGGGHAQAAGFICTDITTVLEDISNGT